MAFVICFSFHPGAFAEEEGSVPETRRSAAEVLAVDEKSRPADPGSVMEHVRLGVEHFGRKDYDSAIEEYDRALAIDERECASVLPQVIFICLFKNDPRAADYYRKLEKLDPAQAAGIFHHIILSRVYGLTEIPGGFHTSAPPFGSLNVRLSDELRRVDDLILREKFAEAVFAYRGLIGDRSLSEEDRGIVHYALGTLLMNLDRRDEGMDHLRKAVGLCPDKLFFRISLIDAYRLAGDDLSASGNLRALLERDPRSPYGLYYQGEFSFRRKNWSETVRNWELLQKVDPVLFALVGKKYAEARACLGFAAQ